MVGWSWNSIERKTKKKWWFNGSENENDKGQAEIKRIWGQNKDKKTYGIASVKMFECECTKTSFECIIQSNNDNNDTAIK